jgi:YVTN family beta-propeller protein
MKMHSWAMVILGFLAAGTASSQTVIDSIDVGGAWVGSLVYNSRAGVVYGASEDGVFFAISCDSNRVVSLVPAPGALSVCYDSVDNKAYCVTQGGGSSDTVLVIDGTTHTRIGAIPVWWAVRVVWNPDNDRVYVSTDEYNKVVVIDCRGDTVVGEIQVGQGPIGLTLNRRHQKLYVQNTNDASVSVVDLATSQVRRTVPLGWIPSSGWYSESVDKYYCGRVGGVTILDGVGDSVVAGVIFSGGAPDAMVGTEVCNRVMVGLDYGGSTDSVAVIDAQVDTVITMLGVGRYPGALVLSPSSGLAYCANAASDNLSVMAGDGSRILGTVSVGDGPSSLLAVAGARRVYVGHFNTRFVYVVHDTASGVSERGPSASRRVPGVCVRPNPFSTSVWLQCPAGAMSGARLMVYSGTGRLVRSLQVNAGGGRSGSYVWDGVDDNGQDVAPGIYYAVSEAGAPVAIVKAR